MAFRHNPRLQRLLKNSAFGWRSASSAAVNALESAKALAAEVTESILSANCSATDGSRSTLLREPLLLESFLQHYRKHKRRRMLCIVQNRVGRGDERPREFDLFAGV